VDSFFWPLTSQDAPGANNNNPRKTTHNFRSYSVAAPKKDQYQLHDRSLYSLWMHYVEFCRMTAKCHKSNNAPKMASQDLPINIFSQRKRLSVFQLLSASGGKPVPREVIQATVNGSFPPVAADSAPPTLVAPTPTKGFLSVAPTQEKSGMPPHKLSPTSVCYSPPQQPQYSNSPPHSHYLVQQSQAQYQLKLQQAKCQQAAYQAHYQQQAAFMRGKESFSYQGQQQHCSSSSSGSSEWYSRQTDNDTTSVSSDLSCNSQ